MMAVSEQRCPHGVTRSIVRCETCDRHDAGERAKPIRLDRPFLDAPGLPQIPVSPAASPAIPARGADVNEILRCVAGSYLVSVHHLVSKDRHRSVAEARQVTAWLMRRLTTMSFPEIGRALGNRDHTTIMSNVKRTEARREEPAFLAFTDALRAAVKARLGGGAP